MRRLFSLLVISVWFVTGAAAREINYYNKSWDEIKARAKAEHKYIFVDCYTDWCGWCKVMDKETMTDQAIITAMTDKFIAVKMDMEKGEGIKLAMKYHVRSFPTFIFFNPDGDYVYASMGYQKTPDFMKELNKATDKSKQYTAPGFSASVDVDYPEFYKKMFAGNGKRETPAQSEVIAFLDNQKDLFSEISWAVLSQCALNEKYNNFFLANIGQYRKLYGAGSVNDKLDAVLNIGLMKAAKDNSKDEYEAVIKMVDTYVMEEKELTKIFFSIYYYKTTKNWDKYVGAVKGYITKKGYEDGAYINEQAWGIYESCSDQKLLKTAASWMKEVTSKEPKYAYLDTYAALLYKSGQVKEAKKWAGKAIETGKKNGDNTSSTEEMLKKMDAAK